MMQISQLINRWGGNVNVNHADDVKKQFEKILSGEEYQVYSQQQENFLLQFVEKIVNWLAEFLGKLIPWSGLSENSFRSIAYVMIALFFLIALLFLFLFINRYVKRKKRGVSPFGTQKEFSSNRLAHMKTAEKYAGKGDYRQGIRYLFLALLLYLDDKDWLKARPWKTNGEYVDELMDVSSTIAKRFSHLAGIFDESFYGGRETTREDYQHFYQLVNEWMGGND